MNEEWRPVTTHAGFYEVSNLGRVRSFMREQTKILAQSVADGYATVWLAKKNDTHTKNTYRVHKLVAHAFLGPSNGRQVDHLDSDRGNSRLDNLEYVTCQENQIRAHQRGRKESTKAACRAASRKLNDDQIREVHELAIAGNETLEKIGRRFGISPALVCMIKKEKRWTHLWVK